jgi:hypothetical protein
MVKLELAIVFDKNVLPSNYIFGGLNKFIKTTYMYIVKFMELYL